MRSQTCAVAKPEERRKAKLMIRYVRKTDRFCASEIDEECFRSLPEEFVSTKTTKVVIAKQAGVIVGYLRFDIEEEQVYLANVCVAEDARGEDICTKMVTWLTGRLDRYKRDKITLYATNDAAVRCYEKAGFTSDGSGMVYLKPKKKKKSKKKSKKKKT